jgi:predicted nucleic acid-binding protein
VVSSRTTQRQADKLLRDFLADKVDLIAPDLIVAEVGNVLWHRSILRGDISAIQASESFANFLAIPLGLQPSSTIAVAAFTLAAETRHRIYDMLYVALAQRNGCEFVTADEKLVNKLGGAFPFIRWVGDL